MNKSRLTDAEAGIIATRNTKQVGRAYLDFKAIRDNRNSPSLLALVARMYLRDEASRGDLVRVAAATEFDCDSLPIGDGTVDEFPPPEVFREVIAKLGPDANATALDNLNTAVVRAGLLRMQDTRGHQPTSTENQLCIAQADYVFEPALAVTRLEALATTTENAPHVVQVLAMARAHAGDFEGAYQTAKLLENQRRPAGANAQ
ncbi:MAG: hypothetical protein R3E66_01195 [bacterium]